ncbi:hypothetical protein AQUCO_00400663v1 [Aquilegia coerulea]|uniref:Uncharacterized protein n=1 Tax=Aquilegia coerulea TaxID=218851 RepID=A0A2G5EW54_AQUCA|nr:hypothetical protein AQUCO_00400663v1 [Aquilegia coerulea]
MIQLVLAEIQSRNKKSISTSQQVVVRETITSTDEIPQEGNEQVNVPATQEQGTQRYDSLVTIRNSENSLSLTNSFTALEGELDLVPETPDPEQLVSEAEKQIGRWGDGENEGSPILEPVGMVVVDPRIDIQYTRKGPCTSPRIGEGIWGWHQCFIIFWTWN